MTAQNTKAFSTVGPIIDKLEQSLKERGYMFSSTMYSSCGIDHFGDTNEYTPMLHLEEKDNEGSYSFSLENNTITVYDYIHFWNDEENLPLAVIDSKEEFDKQFNIFGLEYEDLMFILSTFNNHKVFGYLTIDSYTIDHLELLKRLGWNDRRIKEVFGIVNRNEFDMVQYYPLHEVLLIESQEER